MEDEQQEDKGEDSNFKISLKIKRDLLKMQSAVGNKCKEVSCL